MRIPEGFYKGEDTLLISPTVCRRNDVKIIKIADIIKICNNLLTLQALALRYDQARSYLTLHI
jgi:hypothetical protein